MTGKIFRWLVLGLAWMCVLFHTAPIWAQEPSPKVYDLRACVDQALKANPRIERARLDIREAQWQLTSAKLGRTPSVELFNLMGVVNDAEGDAITGDTIDDEYGFFNRLNLEIAIPIYTFGRISNSIDAAKENVSVQKASQIKTQSELIYRVYEIYYGLVLARRLSDSTQELQKNFTEARDIAEERLEEGEEGVTESDVLKLRVGLSGVTQGLRRLERETEVTKEALRQVMGLSDKVSFEIADEKLSPTEFELKPLEFYLQQAENNNPDLKQARAGVTAEESRYLAERGKFYPSLLAVGGIRHAVAPGREDQDNPFLNDDFNYFSAGLAFAVKWDMNFFTTNADVQRRKVGYLRTKSRLQEAADGIALKVKETYHRVRERKDNLETSFEARKAGRALLFLSLTNFRFGIGEGKDVFDALSVYARTAGSYHEAVYDYNMAVAELEGVIGTALEQYEQKEQQERQDQQEQAQQK